MHVDSLPTKPQGKPPNTGVVSLSLLDLPDPGIKQGSPALQADSLPAEPQRKPKNTEVGSLSLLQQIFGEGNHTPLQYSYLENPINRGGWWAAVHGVAKSQTRLGDFTFTFHFHTMKKAMATHSSVLAWRIPGTAEPGGLPSMESHRVGHN